MNTLDAALKLASQGFYVFPLQVNGKLPAIDDFPNRATKDPEQIRKWWVDPVLELVQPYNVGISTTRYNGTQALVVVDVDNKGKKKGDEEVLKLELEGFDFIETVTQKTPTGGRHLIYRAPEAVKQGVSVLAEGLDIRSKGGYIVGEGSVIDGKYYTLEKVGEVSECPPWIIAKCGRVVEREEKPNEKIEVNQEHAALRAATYLATAPISEEGLNGDQTAFIVAAHLKDLGLSKDLALSAMLSIWNNKCLPPWSPEELKVKVNNAYEYGLNVQGSRSPEADFTPIGEMTDENYLEVMNKNYALVFTEDSHCIIFETVDEKGAPKREFLRESSFKRKFSPYTVQQGRGPAKTYADIWLDYPKRRQYAGLCFTPEREPGHNYYNLWRGFTYKEKSYADAGASARLGFDMFIDHARTNVCGSDDKLFNWLMGYFAHIIQKPYERPLTTLVFRGAKGVGKNVLIDRVGRLLGHGHYLVAHDGRYLTSNFNGHMDSCLCLVLDEAFWSGDKAAEGKLKGLTTSPTILIERKGKEPYTVDNLVRLIVVGNEDWLVPASSDERRYAVYDVGEGRKQQGDYFEKMRILMDHKGGAEILMHYLKNFDMSLANVNSPPTTQGLIDQKMDSLTPFEQFWHQCLVEGKIVNVDFLEEWSQQVDKGVFRKAFKDYCTERNIKSWVPNDIRFSIDLKKVTPSIELRQKGQVNGKWARVYRFRELEFVREEWNRRMGIDRAWE